MTRMKPDEIIKLLDILIGNTEAVGDSASDDIAEANLKTLIDITNWCLGGVSQSAYTNHRPEYSMKRNGERAFAALCEWKDWLEERIQIG